MTVNKKELYWELQQLTQIAKQPQSLRAAAYLCFSLFWGSALKTQNMAILVRHRKTISAQKITGDKINRECHFVRVHPLYLLPRVPATSFVWGFSCIRTTLVINLAADITSSHESRVEQQPVQPLSLRMGLKSDGLCAHQHTPQPYICTERTSVILNVLFLFHDKFPAFYGGP